MVTPNGITVDLFKNIPGKQEEDEGKINLGAVLRVAPIKDVKTMIQAFGFAKERVPALKLWIMGPWEEEEEYARECGIYGKNQRKRLLRTDGYDDSHKYQ